MVRKSFQNDPTYSLNGFEKLINATIHWFFFYRLIWVLTAIVAIWFLSVLTWNRSSKTDQVFNLTAVLTGGSILIGIFYAILNYEMSYYRYRNDQILARKYSAFAAASEWHKELLVRNLKTTRKLYEKYKHLIDDNKSKEFSELLDKDDDARAALISIFNYLESLALGIEEGVHDEGFIAQFFRGIFISYYNDFEFYIQYKRKKEQNPHIWIKFTEMATKWQKLASVK